MRTAFHFNHCSTKSSDFKTLFSEARRPFMSPNPIDLICLSHLRWGFVFQRPQHLMSRFARTQRVFFLEEPIFQETKPHLRTVQCPETGVQVITPVLRVNEGPRETASQMRRFLSSVIGTHNMEEFLLWYYTPMAREFTYGLKPVATVYDCMDELSAFAGAP